MPAQEIGAVVLAAGASRRMAAPKALLRRDGRTFLESWLEALTAAEIAHVRVVLGHGADKIRAEIQVPADRVVINPEPERGMLSSFLVGLEAMPPGLAGYFLCPVDHPGVGPAVLRALAGRLAPGRIVVPVCDGRRGHPVLFAGDLLPELRAAPAALGARAVVWADPARVTEVPAPEGVLRDIDTPEDYRELDSEPTS